MSSIQIAWPGNWCGWLTAIHRWDAEFKRREESERREMARDSPLFPPMEANAKARKSIAQQAQDFLDGKKKWKPSWQSIAADVEIMRKTSNPPGALRGSL
jgi:hypothetical protein